MASVGRDTVPAAALPISVCLSAISGEQRVFPPAELQLSSAASRSEIVLVRGCDQTTDCSVKVLGSTWNSSAEVQRAVSVLSALVRRLPGDGGCGGWRRSRGDEAGQGQIQRLPPTQHAAQPEEEARQV